MVLPEQLQAGLPAGIFRQVLPMLRRRALNRRRMSSHDRKASALHQFAGDYAQACIPGANARPQLSFIRDIRRHVNDADAAIFRPEGIVRILELAFAVADRDEILGRNVIFCNEELFDRVGPPV